MGVGGRRPGVYSELGGWHVSIDLTDDEVSVLRATLDARRRELLHELHHTDDRAFRDLLRHKEAVIEHLAEKLVQSATPRSTAHLRA